MPTCNVAIGNVHKYATTTTANCPQRDGGRNALRQRRAGLMGEGEGEGRGRRKGGLGGGGGLGRAEGMSKGRGQRARRSTWVKSRDAVIYVRTQGYPPS